MAMEYNSKVEVLILVLMEYGLREAVIGLKKKYEEVLILVLMEYGLRETNVWSSR